MEQPGEHERPADEARWFVGRRDVRDAVLAILDEPGRGRRVHATGTWGIGKSALLDKIREEVAGKAVVLKIPAGRYVPRTGPTAPDQPSPMTLLQNADAFATLLRDQCEEVGTEGFARVEALIVQARQRVAEVRTAVPQSMEFNPDIRAKNISAEGHGTIGSLIYAAEEPLHNLEATIAKEVDAITTAFADEVDRLAAAGGAVVLIDEFDRLRGHVVAGWLLEILARIGKAVIVVTSRSGAAELEPYDLERHELEAFTGAEVREYLGLRLGPRACSEELVTRVLGFSGGLPQAVGMAADLVVQRARTGGDPALGDLELDESTTATTTLLSKIVAELTDPDAIKLLREGRLARRIDLDLAHWLLFRVPYEEGTPEAARSGAAFETLKSYSFIRAYDTDDLDGTGRYCFHEYIHRAVPPAEDDALRVDEEGVHAALAAFYEHRRDSYDEENDESAYERWFRNEDRAWQKLTREWLYHCGRLRRPQARQAARLELARILLDAFWWWGCYVTFPFCQELLDDWESTQPEAEAEWSEALRALLRSYPHGYQKLDFEGWPAVEEAIRILREVGRLEKGVPLEDRPESTEPEAKAMSSNRRRVRALTSLLRAHSFRYQTGTADLAVSDYEDALAYFADDIVAHAWTTFELAELRLELGDDLEALAGIRAAAPVAKSEGDYELLANLHRLRGDVAVLRDEDAGAIGRSAGKAVLRAYAFLVPMPDQYTQAFYREQRERVAARLLELAARRSSADAEAAAAQVVEELAPLRAAAAAADPSAVRAALGNGDPAALADLLMPPLPPVGEAALTMEGFSRLALRARQAVDRDQSDLELAASA